MLMINYIIDINHLITINYEENSLEIREKRKERVRVCMLLRCYQNFQWRTKSLRKALTCSFGNKTLSRSLQLQIYPIFNFSNLHTNYC